MESQPGRKTKRWIKILLITVLVLIFGCGIFVYSFYNSFSNNLKEMHEPFNRDNSDKRNDKLEVEKKEPFSVLLLGIDQRANDFGRSDTIIVATINSQKESVEMVSIPRDTRVKIVGKNTVDKINHAFAFGGAETSVKTVEEFLDIPIDYVVSINMKGFKEMVDAVGGITVKNDLAFSYDKHTFAKGTIQLNGEEALAFVRMRKQDPRGDFGRQIRQRQAIEGIVNKALSFASITRYKDIFDSVGKNIKTNMTLSNMLDIQKNYKSANKTINEYQIEGKGTKIGGIYYFLPDEEKLKELKTILKQHLELP